MFTLEEQKRYKEFFGIDTRSYGNKPFSLNKALTDQSIANAIVKWIRLYYQDEGKLNFFPNNPLRTIKGFLYEFSINESRIKHIFKDSEREKEFLNEFEKHNVKPVFENGYGLVLYDLDNPKNTTLLKELQNKEKNIIDDFISYVKRKKNLSINIFDNIPDTRVGEIGYLMQIHDIRPSDFYELLERHKSAIIKAGITINQGNLSERFTYQFVD